MRIPKTRAKKTGTVGRGDRISVTERTYDRLLDLIASRELAPGEVIEERRLAALLNVSRTPLRASVSRLLGEGRLNQLSNGTVVVREIGVGELLELIQVRILLEGEAAALVATSLPLGILDAVEVQLRDVLAQARISTSLHWTLDDEIHDQIADHCGNRSLAAMIKETRHKIRMCNVERMPERLIPACEEHLAIIEALKTRDGGLARQAMTRHLVNVRQGMLKAFRLLPHDHESQSA